MWDPKNKNLPISVNFPLITWVVTTGHYSDSQHLDMPEDISFRKQPMHIQETSRGHSQVIQLPASTNSVDGLTWSWIRSKSQRYSSVEIKSINSYLYFIATTFWNLIYMVRYLLYYILSLGLQSWTFWYFLSWFCWACEVWTHLVDRDPKKRKL